MRTSDWSSDVCSSDLHIGQFGRIEQHPRIAAFKLHGKLIDIAFLAAKAGRQRQRNWPGARINDTEKQRCKIRPCLRYQRDPILRPDAEAYQTISAAQRIL